MKPQNLLSIVAILFVCIAEHAWAQASTADVADIKVTLNNYLEGGTARDSARFASAFASVGEMVYMKNDSVKVVPLAIFRSGLKPGEKQKRKTKIDNVEVFGNAARAKLTIQYETFYFHDLMTLLKTKEGWRIVGKAFYREEKKK